MQQWTSYSCRYACKAGGMHAKQEACMQSRRHAWTQVNIVIIIIIIVLQLFVAFAVTSDFWCDLFTFYLQTYPMHGINTTSYCVLYQQQAKNQVIQVYFIFGHSQLHQCRVQTMLATKPHKFLLFKFVTSIIYYESKNNMI